MTSHHMPFERGEPPVVALIDPPLERGAKVIRRYRERAAARKRARLTSARGRRFIAGWLRRTAQVANDQNPIHRRQDVLLRYRAVVVRAELLEIAAMVEAAQDPDPGCMVQLHQLLSDGCTSPLYNHDVHVSELWATLDRVRAALDADRPRSHD